MDEPKTGPENAAGNDCMADKYLYLNTIGCQMNVYDSQRIAAALSGEGYRQTSVLDQATLVIVNTCTIRAKAEQKAFSFLGRLAQLKKKRPQTILGVGGCVAQQEGRKILARIPHVDLVFGTRAVDRLPALVRKIEQTRCRIVDVDMRSEPDRVPVGDRLAGGCPVSAFVTIMRGCDNFCTYCVVPYVRGRETSRHPDDIMDEIRQRVRSGVREITLLGQNVNSYGKKEGLPSFARLLDSISAIEGLVRIRFTTSHPKDLSPELIAAFGSNKKLCNHIHLPVQSGSNRVLKRMNRKYTRQQYLDKVARLRDTCPGVAITSDVIVGFPGETRSDFEATLELMETVRFDGLFAFMYSDRPNAPAVRFGGKVSGQQKKQWLEIILSRQQRYTREKNQALIGSIQPVLVEGVSKKQLSVSRKVQKTPVEWMGRTSTNKIVNFHEDQGSRHRNGIAPGQVVDVRIEKAYAHSLWGSFAGGRPGNSGLKGDKSYAA